MISIDERIGSRDLIKHMPKNMGALSRMEFGDAAFIGRGPDESPVLVGIERKRIHDLLDSLSTGRLSGHQLPGMINSYNIVYLVIEGIWRADPRSGILQKYSGGWKPLHLGNRKFMAREVYNFLNSLAVLKGVIHYCTGNPRETAILIMSLYHWWLDKSFSAHRSHERPHSPFVSLSVRPRSVVERMAQEIPGVGAERARLVAKKFSTPMEMIIATPGDWLTIPGIGKKLSVDIPRALQEGGDHTNE